MIDRIAEIEVKAKDFRRNKINEDESFMDWDIHNFKKFSLSYKLNF